MAHQTGAIPARACIAAPPSRPCLPMATPIPYTGSPGAPSSVTAAACTCPQSAVAILAPPNRSAPTRSGASLARSWMCPTRSLPQNPERQMRTACPPLSPPAEWSWPQATMRTLRSQKAPCAPSRISASPSSASPRPRRPAPAQSCPERPVLCHHPGVLECNLVASSPPRSLCRSSRFCERTLVVGR